CQDAHQARAKGRSWNHAGVVGCPRFVPARARNQVASPLSHMRTCKQKLETLVASRVDVLDLRKRAGAALARRGKEVHELVHLLGRQQLAVRAATALLTTALALG